MLVSSIVVDDQMEIQIERRADVDELQEADEFLVPVARHAIADHSAVEHAERGKQCGRAVAFVVVRLASWDSRAQRQQGLSPVQGLNLTFLVYAKHQGLVGRIQVQAHDVVEFLDEPLVAAELERLDQMRFQIVALPDAMNRVFAQTLGFGHASGAPVSRIGRRLVQSGLDNRLDFAMRNPGNTSGARRVLFQSRQPKRQKTLPPQLHGGTRYSQQPSDILAQHPLGGLSNNLGPLNQAHREASPRRPFVQHGSFVGCERNGFGDSQRWRSWHSRDYK